MTALINHDNFVIGYNRISGGTLQSDCFDWKAPIHRDLTLSPDEQWHSAHCVYTGAHGSCNPFLK